MSESYEELSRILAEEFNKTENIIRQSEHSGAEPPIPAINELRYAGYHHIEANKFRINGKHPDAIEEMRKAVRHVRRARFDANEFYLTICAEHIAAYRKSFNGYEYLAAQIIPNFHKHMTAMREAGALIEQTSSWDKESPEYIKKSESILKKMRAFERDFAIAETALFDAISEKERGQKIAWKQCGISIILGALLSTVLSMLFT